MNKPTFSALMSIFLKKFFQLFLQGLILLVPIGITVYVVITLFNSIDGILPNIIHSVAPTLIDKDVDGQLKHIPGLGFIVVIALVLFVGWISSSFIVKRLVDLLDKVLENTPGVKFIYSSVKDFLEAFAGNKKKFDKAVLVNVDATDVWRVGFITQKDAANFELPEHVVVYVPHSYAISGITYIVPKERIKPLDKIGSSDVMKFAVSGGVTDMHE
jgi:uncharacterized membrane protein